ncbi:hypothetical protein ACOSP7_021283 [Xanthoceras sorbifolium]
MSDLSNQRRHEGRGAEASVSGHQRVELPQEGALRMVIVAQVATNQQEDVEIRPYPNLPQPPSSNGVDTHRKGKRVDFDASAEQPVQRGMPTHSAMVGQAVFLSSSRGLNLVAKEYLGLASTL